MTQSSSKENGNKKSSKTPEEVAASANALQRQLAAAQEGAIRTVFR